jgi:hypothetical protein
MLKHDELIELILSLPDALGVTPGEDEDEEVCRYFVTVDFPPIEADYPNGEHLSIPDDDFFCGGTPTEALVNALLGTCAEWGYMPDGSPGHIFDLTERVREIETGENLYGKYTSYETKLTLDLPLKSGVQTIYLTDGVVLVNEEGEVVDESPPEFYEDKQPKPKGALNGR